MGFRSMLWRVPAVCVAVLLLSTGVTLQPLWAQDADVFNNARYAGLYGAGGRYADDRYDHAYVPPTMWPHGYVGHRLILLANQGTANDRPAQSNRSQSSTAQQQARPHRQQAARPLHAQSPSTINVTAASNIQGLNVVDPEGSVVGDVDYLIIDLQSGKIHYALVGEGGFLGMGEHLLPVPWSVLAYSPQSSPQPLRLTRSRAELSNIPRYNIDQLFELTDPGVERRIIDYYVTSQAQDQQGPRQAQRLQPAQEQQGTQEQTAVVRPYVLVDRDIVTFLTPPRYGRVGQIRGAEVVGPMGNGIGEIDEVIIDPEHGYVAYVLIEHGGFLGFGAEWSPVPFTALQVAGEDFRLPVAESLLRRMPKLPREDLPAQVSAAHLRQLYAEYDVTPYWAGAGHRAGQPEARRIAMAATVQEIDAQRRTLTLHTSSGTTIDLHVSPGLLATLQEGDRVEVTVRQTSPSSARPAQ
ncbi:MAG: PRC-barrel domain-containing protein [Candidatus Tectimicrobiota bacterium]